MATLLFCFYKARYIRTGFSAFGYNGFSFNKDSVSYAGQINLKTMETHYDFFPRAGGFHVSPGMLVFLSSPVTATASVPSMEYFALGGQDYVSDSADPVKGSGKINFNRVAPEITMGWGNLLPRLKKKSGKEKRFTAPVEFGFAFPGSAKSKLNLSGSVCDSVAFNPDGTYQENNCRTIASDPTVQTQITAEQSIINKNISRLKVLPIVSFGFGFKF